jgi:hypothetical protein
MHEAQWLRRMAGLAKKTKRLYTVAGAAHVCKIALCFPFNRRHDYVSEHQNNGILAFN